MLCVSTTGPGQRIQELRVRSRISARAAGDIAKVSQSTITNIENKADYLDISNARHRDLVKRLARAFNVSTTYIWDGVETGTIEANEQRVPYGDENKSTPDAPQSPSLCVPPSMLHLLLDIATDLEIPESKREEAKRSLGHYFDSFGGGEIV